MGEHAVTNPNGRWQSPVVFGIRGEGTKYGALEEPITFEGAWDDDGARKLAALLPDRLADVREEIMRRFPA